MTWGVPYSRIGIKPRAKHPFKHTTPVGLRRICGTCRHHSGPITGPGTCAKHACAAHGLASGRHCEDWARPDPVADERAAQPAPIEYDTPRGRPVDRREERIAEIRTLAGAGLTQAQAAKRLGIARQSVGYYAQFYGIDFRPESSRHDAIRDAIRAGGDNVSIAKLFGVTRNSVQKIRGRMK